MKKISGLSAIFIISIFSSALAANIYVDNTLTSNILDGRYSVVNRDNSGSDGNAYRAIKSAVAAMQAGDTMYIRGGIYNEIQIYIGNWINGSEDNWYTVQSYPGEWAVIDGRHNPDSSIDYNHSVIFGTSRVGANNYIRFERLEITGGGYDLNDSRYPSLKYGAGINMRGRHLEFRYLYVHNNYGSTRDAGTSGGLQLENGTAYATIEYCHFKENGEIKKDEKNTSISNVNINADYKYANVVDINTASVKNIIRYNLFDAGDINGNYTLTGFKQKALQRLTGYNYADQRNPSDNLPNDDSFKEYGDQIHHNVFINHEVAIEIDQDYAQVYNNIIYAKDWGSGISSCIQGRDWYSSRRGPFSPCVYNNTIIANGTRGIMLHLVPDGWTGTTPYIKAWVLNNIVDNGLEGWDAAPLSIESASVNDSGGWPMNNMKLHRNYFYNPSSSLQVYIDTTKYTKAQIESTQAADRIFVNDYDATNTLYLGTSGSERYKARGNHVLEGSYTIANGGIGGVHPYIAGKAIPTYVGAVDPNNSTWVDNVLSLASINNLRMGQPGDQPIDTTPPSIPSGLGVEVSVQ